MSAEELRHDARLAHGDPEVPGLLTVLDPTLLREWAGRNGVREPGLRVDRLRYKPSTALRAALAPGDDGPWWLLTAHSSTSWRKAGKDLRSATRTGGRIVVDDALRLVLTPAASDRALPELRRLARGARTIAHNPARRAVLRDEHTACCRKVHADPHTARRSVRAAQALRQRGIAAPVAELQGRHVVATAWVDGRPVAPAADAAAVAELLVRMAGADTHGLPVLDGAQLHDVVERALGGIPRLDGEFADRVRRLAGAWSRLALRRGDDLVPSGFAHGDLSPDQLLHDGDGLVVLDVDRACRAPRGWDAASWAAAQTMSGRAEQSSGIPPVLLAAAALLRAPEPFRRRRPGWATSTRALLDLAERALT